MSRRCTPSRRCVGSWLPVRVEVVERAGRVRREGWVLGDPFNTTLLRSLANSGDAMTPPHRPASVMPGHNGSPREGRRRAPGTLLAIVLTAQFMALLDTSIVNVGIPTIQASLRASGASLQLIVAGYTITYAVLLVTGARLGDILGHRRVFLAGVVVFTLTSLGCGLATSAGLLIGLRFAQGVGAAMLIPQVLS